MDDRLLLFRAGGTSSDFQKRSARVEAKLADNSQFLELVKCFVRLAWIDSGGYRPLGEVGSFVSGREGGIRTRDLSVPNRVAIRGIAPELRGLHTQHNASITGRPPANRADDRCLRPQAVAAPSRVTASESPRAGRSRPSHASASQRTIAIRRGSGSNRGRATSGTCSCGAGRREMTYR